ncbi:RNA 2',3'-cyclic phosphodiesterase [Sulfurisoma sediminicola]|uniref:RNA 2',3'-cyclic phosphodiesterase n=1 Tax=Sulfurisoma sediminicola TaxID=1381557 RepID=A0A497XCV5_9PROT|nr:RNA 2',3'-cyclic phosphodiesterase [Sulfurisoma sediminicola]RLJ64802.1 2'-5' RNA ligase [Sulfurisoma sediminicola]
MTPTRRIFFALWPGPEVAGRLHALSADAHAVCGGRRMRRETLHLTLAFLGEVDATRFDLACAIADGVAEKIGTGDALQETPLGNTVLRIDRIAWWKHNHIVWAGCDEVPPVLAALADDLAAELRGGGFVLDSRRFAAHVTLLRNAQCAGEVAPIEAFDWPVREFVLVQSQLDPSGARYEIVRRWPLPGPSARITES